MTSEDRVAVKGKALGRKVLGEIGTAFSPDTILRWHRQLVTEKWDFSAAFRAILKSASVKAVRLPPRSPNLNAHLERFLLSLKAECLDRMIFFGESSLRRATIAFLAHYHGERNHQGLGNRLIEPEEGVGRTDGRVRCRKRLGGMLRCHYRQAA